MPRVAYFQTNFTAGELTPRLRARVNWEKYPNGVEELQNFLIQTHGPVEKRPGLRYVAEVKDSSKAVRMIPFEFSASQTYVLEFGEEYIRFYTNGGQVLDGAVPYEIATPYQDDEIFQIKYVQSADVIFLVHPNYPPKRLSRFGATDWTLEDATFLNGPFMALNETETTIQASARSGEITLTAAPANGPELLANGTFDAFQSSEMVDNNYFSLNPDADWTWGTGWVHDQTALNALHGAGEILALSQDIGAVIGQVYRVSFTVSGRSAGSITVSLGGATGTPRATNDVFTENLTASTTDVLAFTPSIDFDGAIDEVSVKRLTPDSIWTWGTNWAQNVVDENAVHTAGATAALSQAIDVTAGLTYEVVFTVSSRSAGSVTPYIGTAAGSAVSTNTTSTQRIVAAGSTLTLSFVPTSAFNGKIDAASCKLYGENAVVFYNDHVGSVWKLQHETGGVAITAGTLANPCKFTSANHGLKTGDQIILLSMSAKEWAALSGLSFSVTVVDANNFTIPYDTSYFKALSAGYWIKKYGGYALIISVVDGRHARAKVIDTFSDTTPTTNWAEGAWSDYRGYPGAIAFFEERLFFAGSAGQPQTLWGSVSGSYQDFQLGTEDDDAVEWTLSSDKLDIIQWLCSSKVMLIGSSGGIWRLMASAVNEALTPTNFTFKKEISIGSSDISPIQTGIVGLHVQRHGRRVRELAYNFEIDGYVSQDMTLLSDHICQATIVDMDLQMEPDIILWCVLADGTVAAMTYERAQSVVGWHRHLTSGDFESVAVISEDEGDQIWFVVKRSINGATVRYVEYLNHATVEADEDQFFVDCGSTYDGAPADEISGLSYLEGETVKVLADGSVHEDRLVSAGKIVLDADYSVVQVGLGYDAILKTLPVEAGAAEGTAQGKIKRIHGVTLMLENSHGIEAGPDADNLLAVPTGDALFSGDIYQAFVGGYDNLGQIYLIQSEPMPTTIQGIVPRMTTYDA